MPAPGPADRGQITVLLLPVLVALVAAAGLVIDGGAALAARQQAASAAESAARVGADHIDAASLREGGAPRLDARRAIAAAEDYLAASGHPGAVAVEGPIVTVTARVTSRTTLLSIVGVRGITVTARASARSVAGIATEEDP